MDWMWTRSALSLYHWMELEDIYAKIFVLKCWRRSEIAYPTPRGVNRPAGKKALVGGLLLLFFFLCFWGPMALSSFIGATFDFNPPVLCTFSISFGGFPVSHMVTF
ncbi:Piezo-type mechanosensitive ion channel component [Fasciola hepatica]|uniref:Piezo-type mechanosensitive ion channel component n=1 Tax=Fasciola hepatica TaxID=6192 RepID=A0A2H1CG43_FASHE|nr:Piezo-type mechanosensitive ion channel component [Fasciola hepatica]